MLMMSLSMTPSVKTLSSKKILPLKQLLYTNKDSQNETSRANFVQTPKFGEQKKGFEFEKTPDPFEDKLEQVYCGANYDKNLVCLKTAAQQALITSQSFYQP